MITQDRKDAMNSVQDKMSEAFGEITTSEAITLLILDLAVALSTYDPRLDEESIELVQKQLRELIPEYRKERKDEIV